MAKNLLISDDRAAIRKIPLSGGNGLVQQATTAAPITVHTIPEGYQDVVALFVCSQTTTNGTFTLTINGVTLRFAISGGFVTQYIFDNSVFQARGSDLVFTGQAVTGNIIVWGYVYRSPILD